MAESKPHGLYETPEDAKFWQGVRSNPKRSTAEVRSKFRDIDRRLADIEMYVHQPQQPPCRRDRQPALKHPAEQGEVR